MATIVRSIDCKTDSTLEDFKLIFSLLFAFIIKLLKQSKQLGRETLNIHAIFQLLVGFSCVRGPATSNSCCLQCLFCQLL